MRKCRIGTAKFFTLLLLLYRTSVNYLGFYTVKNETVSIARIMYGGRDISKQLEETIEW